jgi:hypothetical protein
MSLIQTETQTVENWYERKGTHFVIFYPRGSQDFAKQVLRKAESDYNNIADFLQYARRSGFWIWDNRVKIYLYPDRDSYLQETLAPAWSNGQACYKDKTISSYVDSQDFVDSVLPHEMAHLIFRDFVGFHERIPLWLDTGIAQWAVVATRSQKHKLVKQYADAGMLIPIEEMMTIQVEKYRGSTRTYVQPAIGREGYTVILVPANKLVDLYYLQSVSIVGFLIEKFGPDRFAVFCRELRDLKTMDEALGSTYSNLVEDMAALERLWLEYLRTE